MESKEAIRLTKNLAISSFNWANSLKTTKRVVREEEKAAREMLTALLGRAPTKKEVELAIDW